MKPESPLKRYWFRFSAQDFSSLSLGCGITAYSYDDAVSILERVVFAGVQAPEITDVVEEVDVSTLDENHVIPNMGICVDRGVWFPQGYGGSEIDSYVPARFPIY